MSSHRRTDHRVESPPCPGIPAVRRDGLVDPAGRAGAAALPAMGRPAYRRGRRRFALHFGSATAEAHYPGRGLAAITPEVTLFACLITPDAAPEQRPLATCSRGGGLALAIKGGTLQLFQAGTGWIDSLISFPTGSWVACAIARHGVERIADFFLFDCDTLMIRRRAAAVHDWTDAGNGVMTLNSRSDGASFIGAITAAGLAREAWSEAHFRRHIERLFVHPGLLTRNGEPAACGRAGKGEASEPSGSPAVASGR